MTAVVITPKPGGRHTVRFRYDPAVIVVIKRTVPGYARSWSAQARIWHVDPDWAAALAAELRSHGHTVTGPADTSTAAGTDWARSLFEAVGQQRVPAVHRALTKVLHPDNTTTGSATLQRELNDARAELDRAAS